MKLLFTARSGIQLNDLEQENCTSNFENCYSLLGVAACFLTWCHHQYNGKTNHLSVDIRYMDIRIPPLRLKMTKWRITTHNDNVKVEVNHLD